MRETFSSVPTARDASLSFSSSLLALSLSFSVSRADILVRARMRMRAPVCVWIRRGSVVRTLCVPPPKAQVSRSGAGRGTGATVADGPPETLRAVNLSRR